MSGRCRWQCPDGLGRCPDGPGQFQMVISMTRKDGRLVVRKAIFRLRRRDDVVCMWFCLQRVTRHIHLRQSLLRYGIFLRFMGRLGFRVLVRVRFSISVGVSVVDGK